MKKIAFICLLFIAGCVASKNPDVLGEIEQREFIITGFDLQQKPTGELSIYDSLARAFNHSLEMQSETLANVVEQNISKGDYNEILPKIVEIAGYKANYTSDFYFATMGNNLETRELSHNPYNNNILGSVWDMVDFALTYSTAQRYDNPSLLSNALRRKAMQNIASDVKLAFYKAAGAQQISSDLAKVEKQLKQSIDGVETSSQRDKLTAYEAKLRASLSQVQALKRETTLAKLELSAVLGLGQYTNYKVKPPIDFATEQLKNYSLDELEFQALERHKNMGVITMKPQQEVKFLRHEVDKLLPNVELGANIINNYTYFQNQEWEEAGFKISWNLISLINTQQSSITAEEKYTLQDITQMATGTAILAEVNISYLRFYQALNNFQIALLLSEMKQDIANKATDLEIHNITDIEKINNQIAALIAKFKIYYAYGELKDAEDMLLISVGVKNYPSFITPANIEIIDGDSDLSTPAPQIKINLDHNIEKEQWAKDKNWLESTVPSNTVDKVELTAPQSIITTSKTASGNKFVDVKNYSAIVEGDKVSISSSHHATIRKGSSVMPSLKTKTLQIGSYVSQEKADSAWLDLVSLNPNLQNYKRSISIVNIKGKGKYYRLLVSGKKSDLKKLCSQMKIELDNSCIIK